MKKQQRPFQILREKGFNAEVSIEDDPDFIGSRYKLVIKKAS